MNKLVVVSLLLLPGFALAEGSPWLGIPGSGQVAVSVINQAGDDFYVAKEKMTLPTKIKQSTVSLGVQYVLSDDVSVDGALNYARSRFSPPAGFPIPHGNESGLADSTVGVKWRLVDEFDSAGAPTVAVRAGAIIKGNYQVGKIDSIGDGSSGVEASVLVGKFLTTALSVSGELGYRHRSNGVPADVFSSVDASYSVNAHLSLAAGYSMVRSRGSLDLGTPAFAPSKFPLLREDRDLVHVGVGVNVARNVSLAVNYGKVIAGRNTTKADVWGASLGTSF